MKKILLCLVTLSICLVACNKKAIGEPEKKLTNPAEYLRQQRLRAPDTL